jgi:hypothetical protein
MEFSIFCQFMDPDILGGVKIIHPAPATATVMQSADRGSKYFHNSRLLRKFYFHLKTASGNQTFLKCRNAQCSVLNDLPFSALRSWASCVRSLPF